MHQALLFRQLSAEVTLLQHTAAPLEHDAHLPPGPRKAAFGRLAAAVAPGGSLLLVGHHPDDLDGTMRRHGQRDSLFTAEELLADLGAAQWEVMTADARPRMAVDPSGREMSIADAVLRVRRRG